MTINVDEFRKYLLIDKLALDDEVVRQPSLFEAVASAYVEAAAERDALKEDLATVDAKLDGEIRALLADEKATEGQIKGKIQVSSKHLKATDAYLAAKEKADQLSILKDAFIQRSFMLRDLCSLNTSNYFESTSMRSTAQEDRLVYERRRAKLGEKRNG